MSDSTYGVRTRGHGGIQVDATITGGPLAYNVARSMAVAGAKCFPGVTFEVVRDGKVTERYVGEREEAVVVRKVGKKHRVPLE